MQSADYNQVIRLQADDAEAYYNRGIAYENLREYQGAIVDYSQAIRLLPYFAQAYYKRGNARLELGDKHGAVEDVEKSARLFREQGDTEKYLLAQNRLSQL